MSNYGNEIVGLDVTNDDMKEMLDGKAPKAIPVGKPKKHVMSRLWALALAVAPIVLLCIFPVLLLVKTATGYAIETEKTLLDAFLALFNEILGKDGFSKFYGETVSVQKLFGLPLLAGNGFYGKVYSLALYAISVAMLLNVILAIVALFSGKKAPSLARAIAFINLFVFGTYALGVIGLAKYNVWKITYLSMPVYILAGIAGLSLLVYLVYSSCKTKSTGVPNFFLLILSAAWVACFVYPFLFNDTVRVAILSIAEGDGIISSLTYANCFKYVVWGIGGLSVLNLFFSAVRMSTKKGFLFDVLRHILHLLVTGACVFFAFTTKKVNQLEFLDFKLYLIVAAAIALLQIILAGTTRSRLKKRAKAKKAAVAQAPVEYDATTAVSEDVEAVRYDYVTALSTEEPVAATPVEPIEEERVQESVAVETPVQMAMADIPAEQEKESVAVEPSAPIKQEEPVVTPTYDYDFYNGKNFDPFMASLDAEEKKQFTEIFILKYHGDTKYLPDYVVGGDNSAFFRKVFIYLGVYRDRITSKLLAKMYTFSSKS